MSDTEARAAILDAFRLASDPAVGRSVERLDRLIYATGSLLAQVPDRWVSLCRAAIVNAERRRDWAIVSEASTKGATR